MRLFGTILQIPIGTVVPLSRSAFFNRTGLDLPSVSLSWWSLPLSDTITNPLPPYSSSLHLAVRHRPQGQAALCLTVRRPSQRNSGSTGTSTACPRVTLCSLRPENKSDRRREPRGPTCAGLWCPRGTTPVDCTTPSNTT
jgi:hypothetical protein